ncbi:MAG: FIG00660682: hypothetical protein, partial [uncultured Nocardioidaceae bacterium]
DERARALRLPARAHAVLRDVAVAVPRRLRGGDDPARRNDGLPLAERRRELGRGAVARPVGRRGGGSHARRRGPDGLRTDEPATCGRL